MTRHIKTVGHGTSMDLISDLPRNVIECILEHMPIQDAVKTSILSRQWRYLWQKMPRLEFDEIFFANILSTECLEDYEIPILITEILLVHEGPLRDFVLRIPHDFPIAITCLSQWMLYLSRSSIEDLELVNLQEEPYVMPSHIFSCLHLTYLELTNFILRPSPDFSGFKCLIYLHLYDIIIESNLLESLISGCLSLEELTISYCIGLDCLNISAPRLKVLFIEAGLNVKSICFKNVKNLVDLTIEVKGYIVGVRRSNLIDFFSFLPNIEKLHLADGFIKFLTRGSIPETLPKMISTLKRLELHRISFSDRGQISLLVCLLKSSPNLVTLVVKIHNLEPHPILNHSRELLCYDGCSHAQLRTVTIEVNVVYDLAVDLAKYILASSPLLEILTFKIGKQESDAHKMLRVTRDLLHIGRVSPRAQINFLCDDDDL